ncbi:MAG TPA: DUF1501 domain-containing protein [Ferruginibacter sp.]|nr:DUF1501 domain-containing protein [Ferruginibacter sp.]HMP20588.1 DUF1501 domain-containing protein [Ferruginibacter sp.]
MASRRIFVKNAALAAVGIGIGGVPAFIARAAGMYKIRPPYKKSKTLVFIFQRGAMDGLMAVTPFTDTYLKAARPGLFMDAAKSSEKPLIDLDGRFGLHPGLAAFEPLFKEKRLAIVHGMGSPNTTRSHFDAQDYMESGTPFNKGTASGWLNRAVGQLGHEATPFRAVSLTSALPRSFYGDNEVLAISNLNDFALNGKGMPPVNMAAKSFEELYDATSSSLLGKTGKESFEAVKVLQKADTKNYRPANGAVYPATALGGALKQIAQLIKLEVGLEVAFAESNGWDTHFNQGTINGPFARNITDLGNSISAFFTDLGSLQDEVTIMTSTEFGRTVKQNGTNGTDHGRASCAFVIGNNVQGGKVYGNVQELAPENLADGRDLAVTTDFRSLFSEVAGRHLRLTNTAALFPGWQNADIGLML